MLFPGGRMTSLLPFATVAALEAATGNTNVLMYCVATDTLYKYVASGAAYTRDGTSVLNTAAGGNTRFVALSGTHASGSTLVYADLTAAEAATGVTDGRRAWVASLNSTYKKVDAGSAYTRDGTHVLNTGDGGDTRWVAEGPTYTYGSTSHLRIAADLLGVEWAVEKSRGDGAAGVDSELLLNIPIYGYNDAATPEKIEYGRIRCYIADASDGTEDSTLELWHQRSGVLKRRLTLYTDYILFEAGLNQQQYLQNLLYSSKFSQASELFNTPCIYAYSNNAGAHEALLFVHSDNASATGVTAKIQNDGTGDIEQWYQGTNLRGKLDTDGKFTIAAGLGMHGVAAPAQATYSEVPADLAACLVAIGAMAAS